MAAQYPYGTAQITSNLAYQPMYTPQQIQERGNLDHANAAQSANMRFQQKPFGGGGFRSGPNSAAMTPWNDAFSRMQTSMPQAQLWGDTANEQHRLNTEQAQFGDVMGQLGNLGQLQNPQWQGVLQSILGSLFA